MSTVLRRRTSSGVMAVICGAVRAATVPGQPTIIGITPGSGQVTVAFAAPFNGNSTITGFTVTLSTGGTLSVGAGARTATLTAANGVTVTATVTATNAVGSTTSASSAAVTPSASLAPRPAANITGVPVGASGDTRTAFPGGLAALTVADGANGIIPAALSGKMTYDAANKVWRLSAANQTFDGFLFMQGIWANANNLNPTFTRCKWIARPIGTTTTATSTVAGPLGVNGRAWGTLTVTDCEYDGGYANSTAYAANGGDMSIIGGAKAGPFGWYSGGPLFSADAADTDHIILTRLNIHHCLHGIDASHSNVTIQDVYIHDIPVYWVPSSANPAVSIDITHSDGIQVFSTGTSGTAGLHDILIQRFNIDMTNSPSSMTGGIQFGHFGTGALTNVRAVDGWVDTSAGFCFSGGTPWPTGPNDVLIDRNRIGLHSAPNRPGYGSYWGPNNVYDVSGTDYNGVPRLAGQVIP